MFVVGHRLRNRVDEHNVTAAAQGALTITAAIEGEVVRLSVAAVHRAIAAACPRLRVTLPEDFFSRGTRSIALATYLALVEHRLAALAARNAQLEARTAPHRAPMIRGHVNLDRAG